MLRTSRVFDASTALSRRWRALRWLLLLVVWTAQVSARAPKNSTESDKPTPSYAGAAESAAKLSITRHRLDNGLRVVLNEDHSAPTVAICVTYDVGGRNEEFGQSGFAHLFEHLMFQGSRNVEKGQHFEEISARGGRANGTTNKDRTNYFQVLPSHELALGLWLEADRMRSLALTKANFDNQRAVVLEEFRLRYSNRVYALGRLRLHQLVFQNYWPYEHPVIGFMEDLEAAELDWARDFHHAYYAPNNAVLSIAGDFDSAQALELVGRYFGKAEAQPNVPEFRQPERMPYQSSERLSVMVDESAKTPGVFYGWRIPPSLTREHRALELAAEVLAGGDSSPLNRTLVLEKASALHVGAWATRYRGPSAFVVFIEVAPQSSVDTAQMFLDESIKHLRVAGPGADELAKAKARLKLDTLSALQTNQTRAIRLGEFEVFTSDATRLEAELSAYDDISNAEVRAAVGKYLPDTKRSVVEVYPPGWVRDIGPPVITKTYIVKKGETLSGIAVRYGMSTTELAKQNGINPKTHVRVGQRLLVTARAGKGTGPQATHTVKKGDTLIGIAKKYGVSADDIAKANRTNTSRVLMPGQELVIPRRSKRAGSNGSSASSKSEEPTYRVRKGDTLGGVALRLGVSVAELAKANGFGPKKHLVAGQRLKLPAGAKLPSNKKSKAKASTKRAKKKKPERTYTVKKGDTLSGIASRHGVSARAIAARNGFNIKKAIRPGQKLIIPNKK